MAKTKYTNREVIENKLLCALDDEGAVAILANEQDLGFLIRATTCLVNILKSKQYLSESEEENKQRLIEMLEDIRQLQREAFGDKP